MGGWGWIRPTSQNIAQPGKISTGNGKTYFKQF